MPPWVLLLLLVLLGAGALVFTAAVVLMAWSLLHPPRMTDGKALWVLKRLTPSDLGLRFETLHFDLRDERTGEPLRVAAWWMPHPDARGRCVVIVHGYADAKVGAVAWAPAWHGLGFNVLALDLRAHGETTGADRVTGGYAERHDVNGVIDRLRDRVGRAAEHVFLFGASYGAAVAAAAAALRGPGDLAGVVLESPFADFRSAVRTHMDLLGFGGPVLQRLAIGLAERLGGADYDAVRPVDVLRDIPCPVMLITPDDDVFVSPHEAEAMESALRARGVAQDVYWRAERTGHLTALHADSERYVERLTRFTATALATPPDRGAGRDLPTSPGADAEPASLSELPTATDTR